jgi:hypothetical protein
VRPSPEKSGYRRSGFGAHFDLSGFGVYQALHGLCYTHYNLCAAV